ncbi:hypothetical protein P0D75_26035 [Paraburkholderia sediminicola]|uniref:hypothetical protein n=1 Tax=Paraburkholderia sediminicola TaxID=458836 RepID=UPI0038B9AD47
MFWMMASDAAAGSAASGADALSIPAAGAIVALCAATLLAVTGDEDVEAEAESSAPQPLNAKVASATKTTLARRVSVLMSASNVWRRMQSPFLSRNNCETFASEQSLTIRVS